MKYARELMDLMAAYPGRQFRMLEIVNYIAGRHAEQREKKQVRMGVWRVIQMLEESGHIDVEAQSGRGAAARYAWRTSAHDSAKVLHEKVESTTETATLTPEDVRPHETQAEPA
ncbi:hypothetical protein [Paraburkholderia atlantica]|uniref:hypothetical protein n=1 Tax=Paraburkholderia atlantica TaxID=2654982 RepID=UPI0016172B3D|nr:hypothetical protein [Paraburkholderia atlantica]MBB5508140.1 hypothetical protein [Paraburkholderia atlantica]